MDRQNVTLEKKHTFKFQRITWYRNRGCKRIPKKFWFVEYPSKIAEKLDKNGGLCCLISKNDTQHLQKNTWKPFFGCHTKKRFSWSLIFVEKFCEESPTKLWENLGKNPSHPQKFTSKPMYIYRFSNLIWMVFSHKRNRKPFLVVLSSCSKSWFTKLKNLCFSDFLSYDLLGQSRFRPQQ